MNQDTDSEQRRQESKLVVLRTMPFLTASVGTVAANKQTNKQTNKLDRFALDRSIRAMMVLFADVE